MIKMVLILILIGGGVLPAAHFASWDVEPKEAYSDLTLRTLKTQSICVKIFLTKLHFQRYTD